jgi:methyl-accepting chemotaxis protein
MAIESAFQVRIGIYRIDSGILALRSEIWGRLAPHLDAIVDDHCANVIASAPYYKERIEKARAAHAQRIKSYTERLLNNPLDEQWVQDAYERAALESEAGFDARSRGAISASILTNLTDLILSRPRINRRKDIRIVDAATRIFMLDAANAVACHNSLQVEQARSRTDELGLAIQEFSHAVEGVRRSAESAVEALGTTLNQLDQLTTATSDQTNFATQAAEDTASKIGAIAHAADKINTAIENMHAQTAASVQNAQEAVSHSKLTDASIRSLSEAVEKISSVVALISNIAAQTNLLALNATIEAARAGEAGKGFAVVAAEVKTLAVQTAKATTDVGHQINLIQQAMWRSVAEIALTDESIVKISRGSDSVAAAVLMQVAAMNEIAKNANGAAANATVVTGTLRAAQDTARRTDEATKMLLSFSTDLSRRSREIGDAMDNLFRAATQSQALKEFANLATR